VIALFSEGDTHHWNVRTRLDALERDNQRFAMSAVSIAELRSDRDLTRRERTAEFADRLGDGGVIPVDRTVAEHAGELRRARRTLRTPDALIAATAAVVGAETLLTTDRAMARLPGAEYIGTRRR
jgi:predicted nucleic acid-binding protein